MCPMLPKYQLFIFVTGLTTHLLDPWMQECSLIHSYISITSNGVLKISNSSKMFVKQMSNHKWIKWLEFFSVELQTLCRHYPASWKHFWKQSKGQLSLSLWRTKWQSNLLELVAELQIQGTWLLDKCSIPLTMFALKLN